jgi:hypothetical protein
MRGFLNMIFALVAGVAIGWLSAVAMIERFGVQDVAGYPLWQEMRSIEDRFAAPYTLSYYVNQGQVPAPGTALSYLRDVDDEGNTLRGNCHYMINVKLTPARYFTFTLAQSDGTFASLGANQLVTEADGNLVLNLAPYPVSGNRLITAKSGAQTIYFTIHEPVLADGVTTPVLPSIQKVMC